MATQTLQPVLTALRATAWPVSTDGASLEPVMERIGNARFVLIGEASHGTEEFYRLRAELTKRLIAEKGFAAVAAEADWPDAFRVNRYVRGRGQDKTAEEALRSFRRFPHWMWRNHVVEEFVEWLRGSNDALPQGAPKVGFYGLDLYSLHASVEAVITYLEQVDPEAAERARQRYACFEDFGTDPQQYGYQTAMGVAESCEDEVIAQLLELRRRSAELAMRDGREAVDEFFSAEQNARLALRAEMYYRAMFHGRASSWNLRDSHMMETLDALANHLERMDEPAKIVVWAHNSHLGDARATSMGQQGEVNLGQLTRERHSGETILIGQSTDRGWVTAASDWNMPSERKRVRPGLPDSYEALFHQVDMPGFGIFPGGREIAPFLAEPRMQRAIGVIYRPETERWSHYFHTRLPDQFDVMIHLDETNALRPLETNPGWERGELPETYPFAE